ncbi:MAG: glycosyltransferase family 4 protein [Gemmatimonadaceae bacterium]
MPASGGVFIAHPGTQHSYQAALALQERGLLRRYLTGTLYNRGGKGTVGMLMRVLPSRLRSKIERQVRRRRLEGLNESLISSMDMIEIVHSVADRAGLPPAVGFRFYQFRQQRFQRHAARMVERLKPSVVVCYDTAALEVFEAARRVGAICVLDQSIGHVTQLIRQFEAAGLEHRQSAEFVADSLSEIRAADVIVTSSQYVVDGLKDAGIREERVIAIPYGVDLTTFTPRADRGGKKQVEALYVGHISRRKGVSYVVDGFSRAALPQLQLTLLGKRVDDVSIESKGSARLKHVAAVPHQEVAEYYRRSDFFVQMSLHESAAMTVFEALASGLPVITTPNSGSVVRDGIEGFLIAPRDEDALAERMRTLTEDVALREQMSRHARRRAEQFSWERYRERFGSLMQDLARVGKNGALEAFAMHRERMAAVLGTESHGRTLSHVGAAAGNGHEE